MKALVAMPMRSPMTTMPRARVVRVVLRPIVVAAHGG
jgi:hypothetical protein